MMTQLTVVCLTIISIWFIGGSAASFLGVSNVKRSPYHKWAVVSLPVLAMLPLIQGIVTFYQTYNQGVVNSITAILFTQAEGRVFMLLLLLSGLFVLLLIRTDGSEKRDAILFFYAGLLLIFMIQLLQPGLEYGSWLGYTLYVVRAISLSLLTGLFLHIGFKQRDDLASESQSKQKWFVGSTVVLLLITILSEVGLILLFASDYLASIMTYYGHFLFLTNLLYLPLMFLMLKHVIDWIRGKTHQGWTFSSFKAQGLVGGAILVIQSIMAVYLPPQDVLRTLETETLHPITSWAVNESLASYQIIGITEGPIRFVIIYIALLLFLATIVVTIFSRKALFTVSLSMLVALTLYSGTLLSVEAGDILVDDTVFPTMEEAVQASYEEGSSIMLLLEQEEDNAVYLVYGIDERDLGIEKLDIVTDGYKRVPLSGVVIDNALKGQQEQAMETRKMDSGIWLSENDDFAYVSFGFVERTADVDAVQIHYDEKYVTTNVNENNVFFHIETTNANWPERHFMYLLNDQNERLADYQYQSMTGGFHH